MTLATASSTGVPSARMVLVRTVDDRGFRFFTNYESAKGCDLAANPRAALVFHWQGLGRQVRVTGPVERLSAEESDAYFESRPLGSRVSSTVSPQSRVITDLAELEARASALAAEHPDGDVPRPPWWGGYIVRHEAVEFWTQRPNRLHDRVLHRRIGDGWHVEVLAP